MRWRMLTVALAAALASGAITYVVTRNRSDAGMHVAASLAGDEEAHGEHADEGIHIEGIETAQALVGEGWDTVVVAGKVTVPPDRLVRISPRIEGKIVSARVTVGDRVRSGQVVAVISSVQLAEARSTYRQANARLEAARANYKQQQQIVKLGAVSARPLEQAREDVLESQGDLADAKSELSQAESGLAQAQGELVQCKARLNRARDLYTDKIVSKQDVETAEAEFKRDTAAVDGAKSKVRRAENRIDNAAAKLDIARQYLAREERVYKDRVSDTQSMQSARAQLESAKIDVQAAADRIRVLGAKPGGSGETIAITSPISGRVVSRTTNVGQMATPSDTLFTVANLSQVWIEADVYEKDLARVRVGQPAEIRVATYQDRVFVGKIDWVGDILSAESRTAKIRCVIPNSRGLLRGEMFATVSVVTGKRGSTVLIPKKAVLDESGRKIVFTPCTDCDEDEIAGESACGSFDKLEIETGPVHGDKIEVPSGLEAGTEVVTVGQYQLKTALGSGKLEAGCADD